MNGPKTARATLGLLGVIFLSGCSVSTLRCGIDGDSNFVELVNLPQDISSSSRYYADLCGFAYEEVE